MFLASQLTEISKRFPAHVLDIRELLLKEKLPVPSPDAIPQLSSRLGADQRFRADVASLMRATLYREREEIGYEDLLGILVAAAAGAEHDLKSESQEAEIREMLRFLLQSRRVTFRSESEPEEAGVGVEAEPVPVVPVDSEPVLRARGMKSGAGSRKLELRPEDSAVAVAEPERREPEDVVLPPVRTSGLFAAQAELDPQRSSGQSLWIVGVVCMALGVGLGLTFRRVVSAAETHIALHAVVSPWSKPKSVASVPPQESVAAQANVAVAQKASAPAPAPIDRTPVADEVAAAQPEPAAGTAEEISAAHDDAAAVQQASHGGALAGPAIAEVGAGVPVTVVRQVVTASRDSDDDSDVAPSTARTRSIVRQGAAGMTAANVVYSPAPEYPAAAAEARVHGEVTVHAVVDPDGKVIYARAVSGPPALRDAAEEAVQKWRYSPLLDNGKPIAVTTTAVLDFRFAR